MCGCRALGLYGSTVVRLYGFKSENMYDSTAVNLYGRNSLIFLIEFRYCNKLHKLTPARKYLRKIFTEICRFDERFRH